MQTWAQQLTDFFNNLQPPQPLPNGIQWLHPQQEESVRNVAAQFFRKFYNNTHKRTLMLGINPGRFGAGETGINFTAPRQLTEFCGIPHHFKMHSELSAEFIYDVITAYGGLQKFYSAFFIGSVCPLGLVQRGKNINYYDDKQLLYIAEPFIIQSLQKLLSFRTATDKCICIGGEKNYRYLSGLNERYHFFNEIVPLPHPRFIMQYRRRQKEDFVQQYLDALRKE
ncbi:MAG: DUF4918 family protein [Flavisolibacter sp.]|nr:DUF4918 family protein [Flavisolibacter sp.]